jgi:hypothetical protein
MTTPIIVTGDDITFPTILRKKVTGATVYTTFLINSGATIVARLVSSDNESVYTPEIPQITVQAGADLPNSTIIIKFTSAETIGITFQGSALLEIQVDDGGKLTWFTPVKIDRGQIA